MSGEKRSPFAVVLLGLVISAFVLGTGGACSRGEQNVKVLGGSDLTTSELITQLESVRMYSAQRRVVPAAARLPCWRPMRRGCGSRCD